MSPTLRPIESPGTPALAVQFVQMVTAAGRDRWATATPLDEVAYVMSERKVGSVIVNEDSGEFLGIFTVTDVLNALIEISRSGSAGG